ncbi:MAG TPA: PAS-domain containing protein [Candidatus Cybelea sp.]|nr:PAS-domain containing protein [Candidatus Cybelea sp.]
MSPEGASAEAAEIRALQAAHLSRTMPIMTIGLVALGLVTLAVYWPDQPHLVLIAWFGVVLLTMLAGIRNWQEFRDADSNLQNGIGWNLRAPLAALLSAAPWAFAAYRFFETDQPTSQVYLAFVVAGLSGVAVASLSIFPRACYAFLLPPLLGLATRLMVEGGAQNAVMAAGCVVYAGFLAAFHRASYRNFLAGVRARVQADRLMTELEQTQSRLLDAIEYIPDRVALFDADERLVLTSGRFRVGTTAFSNLTERGTPLKTILGVLAAAGTFPAIVGHEAEWVEATLAWFRAGGEPREVILADGRQLRFSIHPMQAGGRLLLQSDITQLKERSDELDRANLVLQATFDHITHGVVVFDRDLRLVDYSSRCVEILELEREQLRVGMTFDEFIDELAKASQFPPDTADRELKRRRDLIASGRSFVIERPMPGNRALEIRGNPLPDGGWVFTQTDMTARKRAEAELFAAKERAETASRAKSEFLANMSHELRTPLNAVLGFAELMHREIFGPLGHAKYRDYARDIHDSGAHLLGLINDILDLAKIEAGKRELVEESIDIADLVDSTADLLVPRARTAQLELTARTPGDVPALYAERRAVKQMLLNLLSNAVKFTPAGGRIVVEAGRRPDFGLDIAVIDTGIGMSPADLGKALEPFGQVDSSLERKYEGSGLGLPLVKSLAELHGGSLELKSQPGRGTTATIHFPASRSVRVAKTAVG